MKKELQEEKMALRKCIPFEVIDQANRDMEKIVKKRSAVLFSDRPYDPTKEDVVIFLNEKENEVIVRLEEKDNFLSYRYTPVSLTLSFSNKEAFHPVLWKAIALRTFFKLDLPKTYLELLQQKETEFEIL